MRSNGVFPLIINQMHLKSRRWVTVFPAALWSVCAFSPDVYMYVTKPLVPLSALPPGLLLMVGLMLYPAGWGSEKVISYCGPEALPFRPALCSLGWAFYAAIGGTLASFLCAVLSAQAEIATSSDKVQEEIEEGKSLICLLWAIRNLGKLQEIFLGVISLTCTLVHLSGGRTDICLSDFPHHSLDKISWLLKR